MTPIGSIAVPVTASLLLCACGGTGDSGSKKGPKPRVSQCLDQPYPEQLTSAYILPYQVGEAYTVGQGNCVPLGTGSHARSTRAEFAYDFAMPIGTALLAVHDGMVIYVEESFPDSTRVVGEENTIVIQHEDGSLSNYGHLTTLGALHEVGDPVQQGDIIAMSGDSGASTEPHLHFEILACDGEPIVHTPAVSFNATCRSLATTFRNTRPHAQGLLEGQRYEASQ